jgi:hypothetical protein
MSYSSVVQAEFPDGYYKLNIASGTNVPDVGNGVIGSFTTANTPTLQANPICVDDDSLYSMYFASFTEEHVFETSNSDNRLGSFTFTAWVNSDNIAGSPCIFGSHTAYNTGNYGTMLQLLDTGYLRVCIAKSASSVGWEVDTTLTTGQLSINTSYFIALVVNDGGSGNRWYRVYINGVEVHYATFTNAIAFNKSGHQLRIGSGGSAFDGVGSFFSGRIQNVAFWNSYNPVQTANQIFTYYQASNSVTQKTNIGIICPTPSVFTTSSITSSYYPNTIRLHPNGDYTPDYARIASEGWTYTSTGGTPHYTDVNESILDTSNYITLSGSPFPSNYKYFTMLLDPTADPGHDNGQVIRITHSIVSSSSINDSIEIGVWLYNGNNYIGQYANTYSIDQYGTQILTIDYAVPAYEAANLNFNNSIYFVPFVNSGQITAEVRLYWMEYEVPALPGGTTQVSNISVSGKDATVLIQQDVSISVTSDNVNIVGSSSTISIYNDISINTGSTNISLNNQNVTIIAESNIQVENSPNTINLIGHNVSLITGVSFLTTPEEGLITVNGSNTTISIINPITVNAPSSNIAIDAKNTSSSYYNTVVEHTPVHWWRLTEETSPTSIADDGSSPIAGTSNSIEADYVVGIPGAWSDGKEALVLGGSTSPKGIKFNSNPIANNSNITLEFWIKPQQTGQNASAFVNYFNDASTGISGTYNVRTTIGLYQGKVCVANIYYTSNGSAIADITTVSDNITINQWNHVVLTKSTSGATSTYKSYINGQETATPLSIGTFFYYGSNNITYQSIGTAVDSSNVFIVNPGLPGNTVIFDELAIYNTALSLAMVQEHYSNGRLGPLNAIISVDHTNIYLQGIQIGTQLSINAPVSNISINGRNPTIQIFGNPTIITNAPNIGVNGQNTTITNAGSRIISVQKSNINIKINLPKLKTRDAEFIFINKNDVSLSANDATEINGIDFGGLLYNQIKKDLFKIGNISDFICSFNITVYSKETQVISAVKLSTDNINYSDTIYIENIGPNQMSDNIYVKFDVNALDVLGPGTFLINVEQIYVL